MMNGYRSARGPLCDPLNQTTAVLSRTIAVSFGHAVELADWKAKCFAVPVLDHFDGRAQRRVVIVQIAWWSLKDGPKKGAYTPVPPTEVLRSGSDRMQLQTRADPSAIAERHEVGVGSGLPCRCVGWRLP
jgi:hypothetical protein